jgi:hypothetical protein
VRVSEVRTRAWARTQARTRGRTRKGEWLCACSFALSWRRTNRPISSRRGPRLRLIRAVLRHRHRCTLPRGLREPVGRAPTQCTRSRRARLSTTNLQVHMSPLSAPQGVQAVQVHPTPGPSGAPQWKSTVSPLVVRSARPHTTPPFISPCPTVPPQRSRQHSRPHSRQHSRPHSRPHSRQKVRSDIRFAPTFTHVTFPHPLTSSSLTLGPRRLS